MTAKGLREPLAAKVLLVTLAVGYIAVMCRSTTEISTVSIIIAPVTAIP